MLNVVLVEPEIPANTGNIGRTCVLVGARLHLVGPMGFSLDAEAVRRAGLAYWQSLDLVTYQSLDEFVKTNDLGRGGLRLAESVHLMTKAGATRYCDAYYHDGDWLVFGKESAGLDLALLRENPRRCERIPMLGDEALVNAEAWHERHGALSASLPRDICGNFVDPRAGQISSLNLSNAVAIVLYEALRQTGFPALT